MNLIYKYRLLTRKKHYDILDSLLESQRGLYNDALTERRLAWKMCHKGLTKYEQFNELKDLKDEFDGLPVNLLRGTLSRLDKAYKNFFNIGGFPRYRGRGRFRTLEWNEFSGITFDGKRIKSKAFGRIRVHLHRPLPDESKIKQVKISRDSSGWYACFILEVPDIQKVEVNTSVGIDLGLQDLAILSNGERIPSLRAARKVEKKLKDIQRELARKVEGSNNRKQVKIKLSRLNEKVRNQRQTYFHQVSSSLVNKYDQIFIENLKVKEMLKSNYKNLNRSIIDQSWSIFTNMLTYKAESAGKLVVKVDPKYTSQDCSGCGTRKKKELYQRWHSCECGLELDRDHNAALNILAKGIGRNLTRGVVIPWAHESESYKDHLEVI